MKIYVGSILQVIIIILIIIILIIMIKIIIMMMMIIANTWLINSLLIDQWECLYVSLKDK
jgi:hypothetical protein